MGDGYGLFAVVAAVAQPLAWIGILVGAFLRGTRTQPTVSALAEGAGWVAFVAAGLVNTHQQAQQAVDCSIFHTGCVDPGAAASEQIITYLKATGLDLLLAAIADVIGWAVGNLRRRRKAADSGPQPLH